MTRTCLWVLLLVMAAADAASLRSRAQTSVNPIRRVVTMLQMMQNKVTEEGKKKEELFDKFMCYCENADATLGKSIADAEALIPQLESDIKEKGAQAEQLASDLAKHKSDRADAKDAIAKATAIREKEAEAFAKESAETKSNIDALNRAIPAIEKGMSGAFLQTSTGAILRDLSVTENLSPADRDQLTAFLSESSEGQYAPASGEIVGILKQMKDDMEADLKEITTAEDKAVAGFDALVAAKTKEINAATKAIEDKTARAGKAAVEIVTLKNDLDDTKESLAEDKKFLANLDKNCEIKKKEWAVFQKMHAQELVAIAETIKILNDDDALELFKKTLPSPSLLQVDVRPDDVKQQALQVVEGARRKQRSLKLDFIALALRGKKVGFEKVIKMIDDMVILLGKEQDDDDEKKEYCQKELDKAEDSAKETTRSISNTQKAIEESENALETLKGEIEALAAGIVKLDKDVAEATQQRKEEHEDFTETLAANTAAKELIGFAKNRLNKFYNPKLYKAPPKRELTEDERITLNMGGTLAPTPPPGGIAGTGIGFAQVSMHSSDDAPPPPPPAADLSHKKSGASGGVMAMMDGLVADLDKEIAEMEVEEKNAQEEYEEFIKDSADKRAQDTKTLKDKGSEKADLEDGLQKLRDQAKSLAEELMGTKQLIANLHNECDWLLQNFDTRKEARANEVDALQKAKAVLSGADYSL